MPLPIFTPKVRSTTPDNCRDAWLVVARACQRAGETQAAADATAEANRAEVRRLDRTALRVLILDFDGCISQSYAQSTGTRVGAYGAKAQGFDPADGGRWVVICEAHATLIQSDTRRDATETAAHPEWFCDECRDILSAREKEAR